MRNAHLCSSVIINTCKRLYTDSIRDSIRTKIFDSQVPTITNVTKTGNLFVSLPFLRDLLSNSDTQTQAGLLPPRGPWH